MQNESTRSNSTFREVNSIYTGETTCMSLRSAQINTTEKHSSSKRNIQMEILVSL